MNRQLVVKIPEICYVSTNPQKNHPFVFSFTISFGIIEKKDRLSSDPIENKDKVEQNQIVIHGFHKLLSADKIDAFVKNLSYSGDDRWVVEKSPNSSDIFIQYSGDENDLDDDFHFNANAPSFISDAKDHGDVILEATVEGFENIRDTKFNIHTNVVYTPWAKSVNFSKSPAKLGEKVDVYYEYDGDHVDKILYQNGVKIDTARSPFTTTITAPSNFKLYAFNEQKIHDELNKELDVEPPIINFFKSDTEYFSKSQSVNLTWDFSSVSSLKLNKQSQSLDSHGTTVTPVLEPGQHSITYELIANGFINKIPDLVSSSVELKYTNWSNCGKTSGFFENDVYKNIKYNNEIFTYNSMYYCYSHPWIYKSEDGLKWTEYSKNVAAKESFICISSTANNTILYVMGKETPSGAKLYISTFDFTSSKWTYGSSYQPCHSDIGNFSFSPKVKTYIQVCHNGMILSDCDNENTWTSNTRFIEPLKGTNAISGSYCYFKGSDYAVFLCNDGYIYVYEFSEKINKLKFKYPVGNDCKFVCFSQSINALYVFTEKSIIDVNTQNLADTFFPRLIEKDCRPWMGENDKNELFGIFPDKNMWKYSI